MPMPKPRPNESKQDFLNRCMGDDVMVQDYKDTKQRYAVCNSLWDENKDSQNNSKIERRCYPAEVRMVDSEPPKFDGYSAVFNQLSLDLGGFREKIEPGTFAQTILEDDIRALFNHDENYVVGRTTNGTLVLSEDENGLRAVNELEDTYIDQYLIKKIKRGDITGMSFGFIVPEGGDDWDMSDPENPIRILKRVILWDISPVTYPAYPQTSVGIRTAKQVYDDFLSKRMQEQKLDENNAKYQERKAKLRKIKLELTKG